MITPGKENLVTSTPEPLWDKGLGGNQAGYLLVTSWLPGSYGEVTRGNLEVTER